MRLHMVECIVENRLEDICNIVGVVLNGVVFKDIIVNMGWNDTIYDVFGAQNIIICQCVCNKLLPVLSDVSLQGFEQMFPDLV